MGGGFTGPPGGYIFFGIFVAYNVIILFIGALISVLTRNIPSDFNESKEMTISIYNLVFLGAIIIPFIAWILRTCAILYAFSVTMGLLFLPKVITIFLVDRCKNVTRFKTSLQSSAFDTCSVR